MVRLFLLKKKKKKLTYEDIADKIFPDKAYHYFIDSDGSIYKTGNCPSNYKLQNNALSEKQLEKLLAINQLMNVAKYLNGDWKPNWHREWNAGFCNYYICFDNYKNTIEVSYASTIAFNTVYFKSRELAKQAIEILGEDIIRLALCTDY